jgi:hypothetical protein
VTLRTWQRNILIPHPFNNEDFSLELRLMV